MKILGISSGSKNGNNDSMCKEALMGAKENGAEVEFVRLLDLDLKYCTGCISCVMSLMMGKGNMCVLKDDFDWLLDKMLDADGIVFASPVFVKGTPGVFHTIIDRFGPRLDRGNNIIATKIAEEKNGKKPDPRIFKDKVVSYMGIGGSDWTTRIQCGPCVAGIVPPAGKSSTTKSFHGQRASSWKIRKSPGRTKSASTLPRPPKTSIQPSIRAMPAFVRTATPEISISTNKPGKPFVACAESKAN